MTTKTTAQLKRLMKRAEARGEVYIPPPIEKKKDGVGSKEESETTDGDNRQNNDQSVSMSTAGSAVDKTKLKVAIQLKKELEAIECNEDLKAKDRRSARRKAEAIAVQSSGCASVAELLEWYETTGKLHIAPKKSKGGTTTGERKKQNPYIVFIGQLSYDTTKEELFQHIKKQLEDDHKVTEDNVKIRLLQDPKTKKSRGVAFVEVSDDPELLYSCLKLHHTHLGGRRINVERSAGGGSDIRKAKIKKFREEQEHHMDSIVNSMLEEYYKRGEIQENGEIDEGVIKLCKRHAATVVQAALERYVESNGRDMDNPSAYLTFLLGKLAEEGIYNDRDKTKSDKAGKNKRPGKNQGTTTETNKRPASDRANNQTNKRPKRANSTFSDSEYAKQGVDMKMSEGSGDLLKIFPSLSRGRGRGRGYM